MWDLDKVQNCQPSEGYRLGQWCWGSGSAPGRDLPVLWMPASSLVVHQLHSAASHSHFLLVTPSLHPCGMLACCCYDQVVSKISLSLWIANTIKGGQQGICGRTEMSTADSFDLV